MKKLLIIMVMHSAIIVSATKATAQANFKDRNSKHTSVMSTVAVQSAVMHALIHPAAVSEYISKKFAKQFAGATGAEWIQNGKGFTVEFILKGIRSRAFLTKRGHVQSM